MDSKNIIPGQVYWGRGTRLIPLEAIVGRSEKDAFVRWRVYRYDTAQLDYVMDFDIEPLLEEKDQ